MNKNLLLVLAVLFSANMASAQVINEVQTDNSETIADTSGKYEDWIELYFEGSDQQNSVNLEGYRMIDDPSKEVEKWFTFPDVTMEKGTFLLIWSDGKGELATSFGLSKNGDGVYLFDTDSMIVDQVDVPALNPDQSYGRTEDGGSEWKVFDEPTPNKSNDGTSSVKTVKSSNYMNIYPNPSNGIFNISFDGHEKAELKIYNQQGQLVLSQEDIVSGTEINMNNASGIYTVSLKIGNVQHIRRVSIK